MQHYDEHILELYVLGSPSVAGQAEDIKAHLAECAGCRVLHGNIEEFYAEFQKEIAENPEMAPRLSKAVTRISRGVRPFHDDPAAYVNVQYGPLRRVRRFIARHPVRAGISGVGIVTVAAALLIMINPFRRSDRNPVYHKMNIQSGFVEVFSKSDELLWRHPVRDAANLQKLEDIDQYYIVISDLNGDGINEIATTLKFPGDRTNNCRILRILNGEGTILHQNEYSREFRYAGRIYTPDFDLWSVSVLDNPSGGRRELIVDAKNVARSPAFLLRTDAEGNELGRYWHMGSILTVDTCGYWRDGRRELIFTAINDTKDSVSGPFSVLGVLDPDKITADRKATCADGFGFPPSDAEVFYLKFPISDMEKAIGQNILPQQILLNGDKTLTISCSNLGRGRLPEFDYYFNKNMECIDIKSNSKTEDIREELVRDGKVRGKIDQSYRDEMKRKIEYWDGREWRKEVTKVNHPEVAAVR